MNCQEYQRWIEDAASGALAGTITGTVDSSRRARLDAHLAVCPECRRAFGAAQRLYAAIDQGVAARVEGTPSADFAARLRMRLADEPQRLQFRWWRRSIWIPALGSAALALLLLSIWIVRRANGHRPQPPKQQIAQTTVPASTSATRSSLARASGPRPEASVRRPPVARPAGRRSRVSIVTRQSRKRESLPDSGSPQLQVQIQPGQWAAVTSLYRAGQAGKLGTLEQPVPADKPLQIAPVEVPPLVIAEIQDPKPVGSEPENTNMQDR